MHFFHRLSIMRRLVLTFAIIFLLFVIAVAVSISVDRNMSRIMDGFYNKQFRITVDSSVINGNIEGIRRCLLSAILSGDPAEEQALFEEAQSLYDAANEAVEELVQVYSGDPEALETLRNHFEVLPGTRMQIKTLLEADDQAAAQALYENQYSPNAIIARDAAQQMFDRAQIDAHNYIESSNENSKTLILGIVIISLVMGIFVLIMSIVLIRSITGPIKLLKEDTYRHAHGDLKHTLLYQGHDELGSLAASLQHSADSLSRYMEEIDRALTAIGQGDLDYEIKDIFEGDFRAIRDSMNHIAFLLRESRKKNDLTMAALENAYQQADRANRAKSDFLSHMSHDIRTPMNAIVGMTSIATANLDDPARVNTCLQKIALSSRHLLGLINDVLDMSKIESGKMALNLDNMSLPEVLENVTTIIQPQIKAKKQNLDIRLHGVHHENLRGDALRLNQVFINILSNAVKFTPMYGRICMDVWELPCEESNHALFHFRFEDTGIGMDAEFLKTIFTAFSRDSGSQVSHTEGTGLGMAISKTIVDLMQGEIDVQSTPGVGSVFTVKLRLEIAQTPPTDMTLPPFRVLVVEDDETTARTVTQSLTEIGLISRWVEGGIAAIEETARALRSGEPYDAIILDYLMPELNGVQTAKLLRQKIDSSVPILIISAYDWTDFEDEARASGVNGFISKPLFQSTLFYTLRALLVPEYAEKAEEKSAVERFDFSGHRVLLVEDNELNREVAVELLAPSGLTVDCAENGVEAVTLFGESQPGTYDLILMDVQMPLMDGYEATRQIRALHRADAKTIPIFAMTANAFSDDVEMARDSGMDYHLSKPLDIRLLMRKLSEVLG